MKIQRRVLFWAPLCILALAGSSKAATFDWGSSLTNERQQVDAADKYGRNLKSLALYSYEFDNQDNLVPTSPWIDSTLQTFKQNPVPGRGVYVVVVNTIQSNPRVVYSVSLLQRILTDPVRRAKHVQQLAALADKADGVEIDYEFLNYDNGYVYIGDAYTQFLKELRAALPTKAIIVDALVKSTDEPSGAGGAIDWRATQPYYDQLKVLVYYWNGFWSPPGPPAEAFHVTDESKFALQTDNIDPAKLHIALTAYGWDWPDPNRGPVLQIDYTSAMAIAQINGITPLRDPKSQSLHFRYVNPDGVGHEIWVDDLATIKPKVQAALDVGVRHIDYWHLGAGDPAIEEWFATQTANGSSLIFALTPATGELGGNGFTLAVRGINFENDSIVNWNGSPRPTTFVSPTQLQAIIPASDLTIVGPAIITVSDVRGITNGEKLIVEPKAFAPIRVNSGGNRYVDNRGQVWEKDTQFAGGSAIGTNAPIAGTSTPTLYRAQRVPGPDGGGFFYEFPVPNGAYTVKLKFAELFFSGVGVRHFNVDINSQRVLNQFDIVAAAGGGNTAIDMPFDMNVTNKKIHIDFIPGDRGPVINAIEITAVKPPRPLISSLTPSSASSDRPADFVLNVTGANFTDGAKLYWNGLARPTTFASPTQIQANIFVGDIATPGTAQIKVILPDPNADPSNIALYTVAGQGQPPFIIGAPRNLTVVDGQHASFTTDGGGSTPLQYQWSVKTPVQTTFVDIPNAIANVLSISSATLADNGTQYRCLVSNALGSIFTRVATLTVKPNTGAFLPIRIHAGGGDYTDDFQQLWSADAGFSGGDGYKTTAPIAGTPSPTLYRSTRSSPRGFSYSWALPNGTYQIQFKLAEIEGARAGQRVFDISANGQSLAKNVDIFTEAQGPNAALDKFFTVQVVSGKILLDFIPQIGNPQVNSIEITQVLPFQPRLNQLVPSSSVVGAPGFTLQLRGGNFASDSVVQWNNLPRFTTYRSSTVLETNITSADLVSTGTAIVTVFNPGPGGISNPQLFRIDNPLPTLLSINPSTATVGSSSFTMTLTGSNFLPGSAVEWNDAKRPTIFVSSTVLMAAIPSSDLISTGTFLVRVENPVPGGGRSGSNLFSVLSGRNPLATLTSISPSTAAVNSSSFTLLLSGTGFIASSKVQWNDSDRSTLFISSTVLSASIPASDLISTGTFLVRVANPTPGGGRSGSNKFFVTAVPAAVPTTSQINPSSATAGSPAIIMTVSGTQFLASSTVNWNGQALGTTFVSSTRLLANVPQSDFAAAGIANVTVVNPGATGSNAQVFRITNPLAAITSISPSSTTVGSSSFTLVVNGTNFISSSRVQWNDADRPTVFVSSTLVTASIPASDLVSTGTFLVRVANPSPGGGRSGSNKFFVLPPGPPPKPVLLLSTISPSTATVGATSFTMTLKGSGFVSLSKVRWNSLPLSSVFVSSSVLTASVPASNLASSGTFPVSVVNSGVGGGTSGSVNFYVLLLVNLPPILSSISPSSAAVGGLGFSLMASGENFVSSSTIQWNGQSLFTTFVSSSQLITQIPQGDLAVSGSALVTVFNPAGTGSVSNAQTFTIGSGAAAALAPVLVNLDPATAPVGSSDFILTANGLNFANGCVLLWNGQALVTDVLTADRLIAKIPASLLTSAGTFTLTIKDAQARISGGLPFVVSSAASPGGGGPGPSSTIATDLNGVHVYPNPWRADRPSGMVTFNHLTSHTTIRLFSMAGRLVRELGPADDTIQWDLLNASGDSVASGYYVYVITNGQGQKLRGKLAILR